MCFEFFLSSWQQDAPGSSCISFFTALESAISPRYPGSNYWAAALETKIWVLLSLIFF
jgi:hypothetical protein